MSAATTRVLVLESQTPFVHGGAEILARELLTALRGHGYEAELVSIPFRDSPREELMAHAAAWAISSSRGESRNGIETSSAS